MHRIELSLFTNGQT